jgi:hypothetical protein
MCSVCVAVFIVLTIVPMHCVVLFSIYYCVQCCDYYLVVLLMVCVVLLLCIDVVFSTLIFCC